MMGEQREGNQVIRQLGDQGNRRSGEGARQNNEGNSGGKESREERAESGIEGKGEMRDKTMRDNSGEAGQL
jgi:hypothetical protein